MMDDVPDASVPERKYEMEKIRQKTGGLWKRAELIAYGFTSLLFAAAFFFGVLYPEYGMPREAYRIVDGKTEETEQTWQTTEDPYTLLQQHRNQIKCRSFFYDTLHPVLKE
jgi:hypothetical protein